MSKQSKKNLFLLIAPLILLILCLALVFSHSSLSTIIDINSSLKKFSLIVPHTRDDQPHNFPKDPCLGRRIYIHDLPSKFNQDLLTNCKTLIKFFDFCPYMNNRGFGLLFNESSGLGPSWYRTNQFMLSVIFHTRMKDYECLTNDSSLANAIYAPFYAGLDVSRYLWDRNNRPIIDQTGEEFVKWLRERPEWGPMHGWDHFYVAGRITWDLRRLSLPWAGWGSKLLNLPEAKNMTMLTIESSPVGKSDFAIPYPTYFHPLNDSDVVQWQDRVRTEERKHLFSFSGAPRPGKHVSIRDELIAQCKNSTRCKLLSCVSMDFCVSPVDIIKSFTQSDFCLQPTGDSLTRRSMFDSILAGCIPVLFHPGSAYVQYFWHLPKNYTKYSVYIPMESVKNGSVRVEDVLSRVPKEDVVAMREVVIGLIPKVVYAQKKLESFEDAFDITIKNMLEMVESNRKLLKEGKDPVDQFPEALSWKYHLTGKLEKHEWDSYFPAHTAFLF